jgi:mono/diheme cytochrome c family protein
MSGASRLLVWAAACVAAASVLAGYPSAHATTSRERSRPVVISVTAGAPTEVAFRLSSSSILPWTPNERVTFRLTNKGVRPHDLEVCTTPVAQPKANACHGDRTMLLGAGQTAALTVLFRRRGTYEYLSTVPGEAAAGMKGLIGVGVKLVMPSLPAPPTPVTTSSGATTTTTSSSLVGDPVAGKPLFTSAGCVSCHALAGAGADGAVNASLSMTRPTQADVIQYVTNGSNSMPAYAGTLTASQIDDLAAYIYLVTHTIN